MISEMFRLGQFYDVDTSHALVNQNYGPAAYLWEAFWCKLQGTYTDSGVFNALHMLCLSLFLPFIELINSFIGRCRELRQKYRLKSLFIMLLFVLLIILIPLVNFNTAPFYLSFYLDIPLGIFFGVGLYMALQINLKSHLIKYIEIGLFIGTLVIIKGTGSILAALIVLICLIKLVFDLIVYLRTKSSDEKLKFKTFLPFIWGGVAVAIMLIIYGLWNTRDHCCSYFDSSKFNFLELPRILLTRTENITNQLMLNQHNEFMKLIKIFFDHPALNIRFFGGLTIVFLILVIEALIIILYWNKKIKGVGALTLLVGIPIITLIYEVFIIGTFLFGYLNLEKMVSYVDYSGTSDYDRYYGSFWLGIIVLFVCIGINIAFNYKNTKNIANTSPNSNIMEVQRYYYNVISTLFFVLILVIILFFSNKLSGTRSLLPYPDKDVHYELKPDADFLIANTPEDAVINSVTQSGIAEQSLILRYQTLPREFIWAGKPDTDCTITATPKALASDFVAGDCETLKGMTDALKKSIYNPKIDKYSDVNYFYVRDTDDYFNETFGAIFDDEITNGSLWSVEQTDDNEYGLKLELIATK